MTCAVCKHKWCWVCGFADDYNDDSFRFHKVMVVTCSIISELTHMKWYWGTLLGLFLIVISPLIMLISFVVILNHCIVSKCQRTMKNYLYICNRQKINRGCKACLYSTIILIPFWILYAALIVCIAAIVTVLLIVPQLLIIIFVLLRMLYWWFLNKRVASFRTSKQLEEQNETNLDE